MVENLANYLSRQLSRQESGFETNHSQNTHADNEQEQTKGFPDVQLESSCTTLSQNIIDELHFHFQVSAEEALLYADAGCI